MIRRLLALVAVLPCLLLVPGCSNDGMAEVPAGAKKVDNSKDVQPPSPEPAKPKGPSQGVIAGTD